MTDVVTKYSCENLEIRRLLAATLGGDGALQVVGTSDADVVGIRADATTLRVDLNSVLSKFSLASVTSISIDLGDGADRLDIAEGVFGVYALGGLGDDTMNGGTGKDTLTGGGGKDSLTGNLGDDRLDGGPSADRIFGLEGGDRLYGGDANDQLDGGPGVDRLYGQLGNDQLLGGSSNDKIYGDEGNDSLYGNNQDDLLIAGAGDDFVFGGEGNDTLEGQDGDDLLNGEIGNDTAFGENDQDELNGGVGNDTLDGGDGVDTIRGTDGDDNLLGAGGDDSMYGGAGNDSLDGGGGADNLRGETNNDTLSGGDGNDGLYGGAGDNILIGNGGGDRMLTLGNDQFPNRASIDAIVSFKKGDESWTDDEILQLDAGLRMLQARTGNTKLLKRSDGADITISRFFDLGVGTLAVNAGKARIYIADLTFTEPNPFATIIHELGHNFDTDDENPTAHEFFELSHWREQQGFWTYDPKAVFANDYGRTNPYEDFATSLEVYFSKTKPASQFQVKWSYMDRFLNDMSA